MAAKFYYACMVLDTSELHALQYDNVPGIEELSDEVMKILGNERGWCPKWKVIAVILRIGDPLYLVKHLEK